MQGGEGRGARQGCGLSWRVAPDPTGTMGTSDTADSRLGLSKPHVSQPWRWGPPDPTENVAPWARQVPICQGQLRSRGPLGTQERASGEAPAALRAAQEKQPTLKPKEPQTSVVPTTLCRPTSPSTRRPQSHLAPPWSSCASHPPCLLSCPEPSLPNR